MNRDLDDEPRPPLVGSYEITQRERDAVIAVVTSGTLTGKSARIITTPPSAAYFSAPVLDEDGRPLPPRPWEPPGPPPRRHLKWKRRMVLWVAILAVAFLALTLFMCVPGPYGPVPG